MSLKQKRKFRLRLAAIGQDEATGEYLVVVNFRDLQGAAKMLVQPRSDLDNVSGMIRTLKDAGAYFSANTKSDIERLRKRAATGYGVTHWKFAASTGWSNGHRAFVLRDRVLGQARGSQVLRPPRSRPSDHSAVLGRRGTLAGWHKSVARPARYSSRMVLAVCCCLAAPLLSFAQLNSFGIFMHGPSKSAKSTMLVALGSVIGLGTERDLPNFRTTDAALGELPAAYCDMALPLNEVGLLKGSTANCHERLRDFSYGLAEGRGTTYSRFAPIDKGLSSRQWRCIAIGNGEQALDEISAAAGEMRATGSAIRWIDLPATRKGADDMFDRCPRSVTGADRKLWVRRKCKAIRRGARRYHGEAIEHFVKAVIKRRKFIRASLRKLTEGFVRAVRRDDDNAAVLYLAETFGHIRAAGILGVRLGTLPWPERLVDVCIKRCFRDARRALRLEADLLRHGLRRLRRRLSGPTISNFGRAQKRGRALKGFDGYIQKVAGTMATIRGERFKTWFKDARQPAIVLRWLHAQGALRANMSPRPKGRPCSGRKVSRRGRMVRARGRSCSPCARVCLI